MGPGFCAVAGSTVSANARVEKMRPFILSELGCEAVNIEMLLLELRFLLVGAAYVVLLSMLSFQLLHCERQLFVRASVHKFEGRSSFKFQCSSDVLKRRQKLQQNRDENPSC